MSIKKTVRTNSGITTVSQTGLVFFDNRISGITSTVDANDVASKSYADSQLVPSSAGQGGKFLTTTDGTIYSWDYVSNSQEFTTSGTHTFSVPSQANLLFIEAVAGGSGGSAGSTGKNAARTWTLRTVGYISGSGGYASIAYGNNLYTACLGFPARVFSSTDSIIWTETVYYNNYTGYSLINNYLDYVGNFYIHSLTASGSSIPYLLASTDGIVWQLRTSTNSSIGSITDIAYKNNNNYVAIAYDDIFVSTDTIVWTARTSGLSSSYFTSIAYGNDVFAASMNSSYMYIRTSTDSIVWTLRNTVDYFQSIQTIKYVNDIFVIGTLGGAIATSTNAVVWTLRTSGLINTIYDIDYNNQPNNTFYFVTSYNEVSISTDTIVWTVRTTGFQFGQTKTLIKDGLILTVDAFWNMWASYAQKSGAGGRAGSYTSWYIPTSIVYSNLTFNIGAGGTGATIEDTSGSVGTATTISWTGPNNQPFIITVPSVVATALTSNNPFYTTIGGFGADSQLTSLSSGYSAKNQINKFQPTGGGSGVVGFGTGGNGGAVYQYGTTIQASGGTPGNNGSNATVVSGLTYGFGGGGGGATVSIAATGGNGVRGGGGGGGAISGTLFGNGGNGGDGYVKINWW